MSIIVQVKAFVHGRPKVGAGGGGDLPWKIKYLKTLHGMNAKYHYIRSIVCLLPEELLTFCSVIYSNLRKKMSSHFTRRIQDNIDPPPPPCIFFCGRPCVCNTFVVTIY